MNIQVFCKLDGMDRDILYKFSPKSCHQLDLHCYQHNNQIGVILSDIKQSKIMF